MVSNGFMRWILKPRNNSIQEIDPNPFCIKAILIYMAHSHQSIGGILFGICIILMPPNQKKFLQFAGMYVYQLCVPSNRFHSTNTLQHDYLITMPLIVRRLIYKFACIVGKIGLKYEEKDYALLGVKQIYILIQS